jgi:hypothetical protein
MPLLNPGDPFPQLTISTHPRAVAHPARRVRRRFAVVLFYRGAWCAWPRNCAQPSRHSREGEETT